MKRIDAHIHLLGDDPQMLGLLEEFDLKVLNIDVAHGPEGSWRQTGKAYQKLIHDHPDRYAWCTSFDPFAFNDRDYADRVIAGIQADLDAGAIACKVWKNVGMEIFKAAGEYIMVDDPVYKPIYDFLERNDVPLLMHIAEPLACWLPLDQTSPHYGYYNAHPEWHMHGKDGMPSHAELMAARDRLVERHPRLRVIGAHMASLEYSPEEVADRFRRFPNFAVDSSARTLDLMQHDAQRVRDLFHAYPDRILFGTDIVKRVFTSTLPADECAKLRDHFREIYMAEFAYYESAGPVQYRQWTAEGLNLPLDILERFYVTNALTWYPRLTLDAPSESHPQASG